MASPTANRPKITNHNIVDGYVTRYFVKHVSRHQVVEVDPTQYRQFSKSPYHQTISLNWVIGGNDVDLVGANGLPIRGAAYQNTKITEHYDKQMRGIATHLRNPLEFFSGTRLKNQLIATTFPSYSQTQFASTPPTAEDPVLVWTLSAEDTIPTRGADLVGMGTYAPDNPLDSGWTGYDGGAASYTVRTFGAVNANIANPAAIYSNVSFDHTNIRLYTVLGRYSVDRTGSGILAGLYYNAGFLNRLYIVISRQTAGASIIDLVSVNAADTPTILATTGVDLGTNEAHLFILEVSNGIAKVYYDDALGTVDTSTVILESALPTHLTELNQTQSVYVQSTGGTSLASGHYYIASLAIWNKI